MPVDVLHHVFGDVRSAIDTLPGTFNVAIEYHGMHIERVLFPASRTACCSPPVRPAVPVIGDRLNKGFQVDGKHRGLFHSHPAGAQVVKRELIAYILYFIAMGTQCFFFIGKILQQVLDEIFVSLCTHILSGRSQR